MIAKRNREHFLKLFSFILISIFSFLPVFAYNVNMGSQNTTFGVIVNLPTPLYNNNINYSTLFVNDSLLWNGHPYSDLTDNYVPYTGASANVDLGANNILTSDGYYTTGQGIIKNNLDSFWMAKYGSSSGIDNTGLYFNLGTSAMELRYLNNPVMYFGVDGNIRALRGNFTSNGYSGDFGRTNAGGVFYSSTASTALASSYLGSNVSGLFVGSNGNIAVLGTATTAVSATGNVSVTNGDVYINTVAVSPWLYNQTNTTFLYNQSKHSYALNTSYYKWWYNQSAGSLTQYGKWWYNMSSYAYGLNTSYGKFWYNQSAGGSFIPYSGATESVDLGNNDLYINNSFKYNATTGDFSFGITPEDTYSIEAPTNVVATIDYNGATWSGLDGYNYTYKIVACKLVDIPNVGLTDICSEATESNTAQVVGSGSFDVNITLEMPIDAEYGYAFVKDENRGSNYDYYLNIGIGNFPDSDQFTFGASPGDFTNSPYSAGNAGAGFYYNETAKTIVMKTVTTNTNNFTISGDLNVSGNIFGTIAGYIPYTGATGNIDLGANEFKVNFQEGRFGLNVNKSTGYVGIGSKDSLNMFDIYNDLGTASMSIRADSDRASLVDMISGTHFFRFGKECEAGGCLVSGSMPYENYFYSGGEEDLSFYTNSFFVGGFNGTTGYFSVGGRNPKTQLDIFGNATIRENLSVEQHVNIKENLVILGNISVKRPYWNGYDNSTQPNAGTTSVTIMNISNNDDYDAYGIHVVGRQNLTFDKTGDYLCIVSPEFTNAGATADVGFWMQKNGVDVPWTNSRYTITNAWYSAPAIPFQFDITNPATDNIRFMWWSSNANTVLYSSGALSSPTRPSVPAVIINCQKVSEIT